jgi:hypothetical protein
MEKKNMDMSRDQSDGITMYAEKLIGLMFEPTEFA